MKKEIGRTTNVIHLNNLLKDNSDEIENLLIELKDKSNRVQDDFLEFFKFMLQYEYKAKELGLHESNPNESEQVQKAKQQFITEFNLLSVMLAERTVHAELSIAVSNLMSVEMKNYLTEQAKQNKLESVKRTLNRLEAIYMFKKEDSRISLKIKEMRSWLETLKENE